MKTTMTLLKSLVLLLAVGFATRASAQCAAGFTYTVNGGAIIFTNTSTAFNWPTYSWDFGDNTYSYTANPTHTYSAAGTYVVCLTLVDSSNNTNYCTNTFCDTVIATTGCGLTVTPAVTNPSNCSM